MRGHAGGIRVVVSLLDPRISRCRLVRADAGTAHRAGGSTDPGTPPTADRGAKPRAQQRADGRRAELRFRGTIDQGTDHIVGMEGAFPLIRLEGGIGLPLRRQHLHRRPDRLRAGGQPEQNQQRHAHTVSTKTHHRSSIPWTDCRLSAAARSRGLMQLGHALDGHALADGRTRGSRGWLRTRSPNAAGARAPEP